MDDTDHRKMAKEHKDLVAHLEPVILEIEDLSEIRSELQIRKNAKQHLEKQKIYKT